MNRLLPWTGEDGRFCYLSTDGTGPLTRLADEVETLQLALAARLLTHARAAFDEDSKLGPLAAQLVDALHDALLIAASRGARLAPPEPYEPEESSCTEHCLPSLIEVAHDTLARCPAAPQALGLLALPGDTLTSARAARLYVRATAQVWGLPPDTIDALETIIAELTANALEHTASHTITVALSRTARTIVVSVTDEGNASRGAVPDEPDPEQECGRGLLITAALATRWGQRQTRTGLTVWADLTIAE
ncbi:ATP-binding protein [Streptomyces sp. 21So2-11]|uniref:ATP-binding protein n=1 Tax=Streptomyces sp. 21So2-11 TaxID=3144408 RepID=UPI0032194CA2